MQNDAMMPKSMNMLNTICIMQIKNSLLAADKPMVLMAASFLKSVT